MKTALDNDEYFDSLLREALLEAARRDYEALPSSEVLESENTPSPEFFKKVGELFKCSDI